MEKAVRNEKVVEFGRWTASRKAEAVLEILKGKSTMVDFCRKNDLKQSEVERWVEEFIKSGKEGLKGKAKEKRSQEKEEIEQLRSVVGEQALQIRVLKKSIEIAEEEEDENES